LGEGNKKMSFGERKMNRKTRKNKENIKEEEK
jgi:hypothetical protein